MVAGTLTSRRVAHADQKHLGLLWRYLVDGPAPEPSDVLFCFGCRDLQVPRRAADLYQAGLAPWVLVTGRGPAGRGHHVAEADVFAAVLAQHGVPRDRIVVERTATNTGENVALGMHALDEAGVRIERATLVTWPLSQRRCVATFARRHSSVRTYSAPTSTDLGAYLAAGEEALRRQLLAEFHRILTYPARGYIAEQRVPARVLRAAERLGLHAPETDLATVSPIGPARLDPVFEVSAVRV